MMSKNIDDILAEAESKQIQDLKADNIKLLKQLDKAKNRKEDMIDAVYEAVSVNLKLWDKPKIPKPNRVKKTKNEEIAIAVLSDIQLAKVTPDYNSEVAEKRVIAYANKIVELTNIQRQAHPISKIAVFGAGDIIEGELIFPGQSHLIDSSLYKQVTLDGPRIMTQFFDILLANFNEVDVHWVIGNHGHLGGRSRKDYHPDSNADRMLGSIMSLIYDKEERIKWTIPDSTGDNHWFDIANLGKKCRFLIWHGDNVRGFQGFPWYGFGKKLQGWKTLAANKLMPDFDYAVCGHFHTPTTMYINDIRLWANGSTESYNTYALEQLASMGRPCQWLLFCKPGTGVTAEYLVKLDDV
jgi:hypothetical protein|tara:strand:+ start:3929 stop:4987 length:1059 start_codon:yes stop_codon:yes gene_type:complete